MDTSKAWNKLKARLEEDGLITDAIPEAKVRSFPLWMKLAASVLLLVAAGTMIFLGIANRDTNQYMAISNGSENLTLVKTLEDGSVAYLADNSTLSLPSAFSPDERRVIVKGEIYFDVAHNPVQPFRVEAGNTLIEVLGTSFSVKTISNDQLEIFVESGLVKVNAGKNETVLLEAGDLMKIQGQGYSKTKSNDLLLALWRQQRMHFKDEKLADILNVINSNYNTSLVIQDDTVSQRQLTVTFFNNSLPTIVELLCLSMNLQAHTQTDSSIILTPR